LDVHFHHISTSRVQAIRRVEERVHRGQFDRIRSFGTCSILSRRFLRDNGVSLIVIFRDLDTSVSPSRIRGQANIVEMYQGWVKVVEQS
jgi:hypothetical protein